MRHLSPQVRGQSVVSRLQGTQLPEFRGWVKGRLSRLASWEGSPPRGPGWQMAPPG
jgi:hypothetical protein